MNTQAHINYYRIAEAISYLKENFKSQPDLDEVAEKVNLSPFHFQRLFSEWAGVSPKKFLQYLNLNYAKQVLKDQQSTLFEAALQTGLSGTGRLHDLFVNVEGMTPGEFKNGGENLHINYSYAQTPFGHLLIASTTKGVCYMAFADNESQAFDELKKQFPLAGYQLKKDEIQESALQIFEQNWSEPSKIKLHLKGTPFQLKVWETLLKVPLGQLTTYGNLAKAIGHPNASRAVGSAVGDNPIAFLIPCHRVIQSSGHFGQYHWGQIRKNAMLGWEAAQIETAN